MTQYVLQTKDDTKQLIKCYTVSEKFPIRPIVPDGRTQLVITDTDKYNEAVAVYEQYGVSAKYTIADDNITWTIPSK